ALPQHDAYTPDVWGTTISEDAFGTILNEQVVPRAAGLYAQRVKEAQQDQQTHANALAQAELEVRGLLSEESRAAGMLLFLRDGSQFGLLESLFYNGDQYKA